MIDIRLAVPAAAAWGSLVLVLPRPELLPMVAASTAAGGFAAVAIAVGLLARRRVLVSPGGRRGALLVILPVVALVCLGVASATTSATARAEARRPAAAILAASEGHEVELKGRVLQIDAGSGNVRMQAETLSGVGSGDDPAVRVDLTVFVIRATFSSGLPRVGDRVTTTGRLSEASPGDEISFLVHPSEPSSVERSRGGVQAGAAHLRQGFAELTRSLPGDGGALLPGLSIGDASRVDAALDASMTATGLSHLTAVSGANCAVVVGTVLLLGGAVGVRRGLRLGSAAVALVAFVVLVTPEPSVERAAVMALLALLLQALGRPIAGVPLLAAAVLILLLTDPWLARSYAFSLSVLATAGLVVLAKPLTRLLARVLPEQLALVLAVPLAAQVACQPLLLTLDPAIPIFSTLANLLAGPVAPLATILGLVACLLAPVWGAAALAVASVAWVPASWIAAVARFFAEVPAARVEWGSGSVAVLVAVGVALLVAAVVLTTPYRRSRVIAVTSLLAVVIPLGSVITGREVGEILSLPGAWQFAQCDVGQGDAVLVRSQGVTALIDTGDDELLLANCLALFGVKRIDLLVLTHYDRDHVGAAPSLIGRASAVLVGPTDGSADERLDADFALSGARLIRATPGMTLPIGALVATVLWPPDDTTPGNTASVVVDVRGGSACEGTCLTGVFLGDLGEREQSRLLGRESPGHVDVVKVSHHGSRDQSPALYAALSPTVALIGVGADNRYGHPTAQTLTMLRRLGARVERSDTDGSVAIAPGAAGAPIVWQQGARLSAAAPRLDSGRITQKATGGGTWLRARRVKRRRARSRSTRSRGIASGPPGWSSSRGPSSSSPTAPSVSCATNSEPKIRVSRSTISKPTTTVRASSSRWRAPPSSPSHD